MSPAPPPQPKRAVVQLLREFSIPLLAGVAIGLVWANLDPKGYVHVLHASPFGDDSSWNFHFVANDLFMVFFFGIAAKEITEACLPGGALYPLRRAVSPLCATLGGVLGPACVYTLVVALLGAPGIGRGWGVPTATDIALAWLVARLVFGERHPAVSFLLLLAVADDGIGLAIIAIFYPDPSHPVVPAYLGGVVAAMAIAYLLRRLRVQSPWPYLLVPGVLSWLSLHFGSLHPALALVPVVPFMPSARRDAGLFVEVEGKPQHDALGRFEHAFKKPVDFGLLIFGVANAGVTFSDVGPATLAVALALVVGKPLGITLFGSAARLFGFPLPHGMTTRSLVVAGVVAGMGLTVALFVASVAFTDPVHQGAAKMGALASGVAALLALALGRLLGVKDEGVRSDLPSSRKLVHRGLGWRRFGRWVRGPRPRR